MNEFKKNTWATLSDVALTWLVLSVTLIASLAWVWPPSTSTR